MDEKPTAILQAEEVHEETTPVVTPPVVEPPQQDNWSKFPPQVEDMSNSSTNNQSKAGKGLVIFVVVLVLLAVAIVGFVIYKSNSMSQAPIATETTPTPAVAEVVEPTATPAPLITDKSEVTIQILNGSGIVGQAGQIATALEKEDFKTPETGNFDGDKQSDTIVNYTSEVDKAVVDEVVSILKKTFSTVNASVSATLTDFDIQIITGTDK